MLNILARPGRITAKMPATDWIAPPGNYMLFLISGSGVPSKAVYIGLGGAVPKAGMSEPSLLLLLFLWLVLHRAHLAGGW